MKITAQEKRKYIGEPLTNMLKQLFLKGCKSSNIGAGTTAKVQLVNNQRMVKIVTPDKTFLLNTPFDMPDDKYEWAAGHALYLIQHEMIKPHEINVNTY